MQIQEILIIKNGSENYGIPTEYINHISRVPSLMNLPLKPKGARGLCGVGGSIVAMVDVNLLLGMPLVDLNANESRLLSLNGTHSSSALLVGEVYNTVNIDEKNIEYANKENDPVIAIYKYKKSLVQILSLDILFSKINKVKIQSKEVFSGKVKVAKIKEEDSNRFLIFAMSNEKFALSIEFLREIILADVKYTHIAGSPKELLGLITLRENLIAVVDLRTYYGFKSDKNEKNRILVASYNGDTIGLLVDEIIDIKSFLAKDIEYMNDNFQADKISGVIHSGDSLISFFDNKVLEVIFRKNKAYIEAKSNSAAAKDTAQEAMEAIVFKLSGKEYAFNVECVAEIIDIVNPTNVAFSGDDIDGIINIRGQIVTIVSLFKKLNIPTVIHDDSKIIVCDINHSKIGFVVDGISDILSVKKDELKKQDDELFTHVLHLANGKRLVLLMDINKVVSRRDA